MGILKLKLPSYAFGGGFVLICCGGFNIVTVLIHFNLLLAFDKQIIFAFL